MLWQIAVVVAIAWAITAFVYVAFSRSIVEASYRGESIEVLNRIVAHHRSLEPESHGLAYYQHKRTTVFVEVSLLFVLLESYLLLEVRRHKLLEKLKQPIRNFFISLGHPVNLAVFRIVFFGFFAWWFELDKIVSFSQLPRELQVPPIGFGWFLHNVGAFDPMVVTILGRILRTACITAAIGFFARSSAFVVAVLGFFLCGIPQSYGKIDSYQHMIWFASLLSVSRCADMLSIDAVIRTVKRADRGITAPPAPSLFYALPLRIIWILMGIIYFSAGMWKAIDGRWNWIFSESLKYHIYTSWYVIQRIPRFAHFVINEPAWFFQVGALATIVFELSFIALVFFPRARIFAAALGLFFHNTLGALMRNIFLPLQVCYLSLLDWHRICLWFGRQYFRQPMYVVYDEKCKRCRRTVSSLQVLDVFERIIYVDAAFQKTLRQNNLDQRDQDVSLHDMHTLICDRTRGGHFPYCSVAKRIPLLWFVYPFLFLWSLPMFGRRIYSTLVHSKTCDIQYPEEIPATLGTSKMSGRLVAPRILVWLGASLIATNAVFGLLHVFGWPFSCGPAFNHIATPKIRAFAVERVDGAGNVAVFDHRSVFKWLSGYRLAAIYDNIYRHPERPELPTAFCGFLRRTVPEWNDATLIRFYVERVSVLPTELSKNPLERKLFFECKQSRRAD
jgi:predicted DCC family thiol-disulfide oxidoreductase YuxK